MTSQGLDLGSALTRIENKLDDLRERLTSMEITSGQTQIKQIVLEGRIQGLEGEVKTLRTSHDRAIGALKLLSLPSVISVIYAIYNLVGK